MEKKINLDLLKERLTLINLLIDAVNEKEEYENLLDEKAKILIQLKGGAW